MKVSASMAFVLLFSASICLAQQTPENKNDKTQGAEGMSGKDMSQMQGMQGMQMGEEQPTNMPLDTSPRISFRKFCCTTPRAPAHSPIPPRRRC